MSARVTQFNELLDRIDARLVENKRWLFLFFVASFILKLTYVLQSADSLDVLVPIMDARYYDRTAQEIAAGGVMRGEAFFMGPLYPYFLSVIYGLVGRSAILVRIVQMLGGSVTVLLTYALGARLFRPVVGLVAALLTLFYGALTFYEGQMLMTWMGTLLNTAMLVVLISAARDNSTGRFVLSGVLLGVSALARANVLVFVPVAVAWIALVLRKPACWRNAAAFAAATFVAVLPATIHNYVASKDFVLVTSNAGLNFYIGNNARATGIFESPPGMDFVNDATSRIYIERLLGRDLSPSEVSDYWFDRATEDMAADPGRAFALMARKTAMFFNGYEIPQIESYDLARRTYTSLRLLFVNFWFLLSFGALGMLFSLRRWRQTFPLLGFVITYAVSIIVFFITARYRVPVAPVLTVFAAYTLVVVLPARLASFRAAAAVGGIAILILLVTNPNLFALDRKLVTFREHVHEARRLGDAARYQEAIETITDAIELYPKHPEGYVHRAIIYKASGDNFRAIEDYSRAIERNPGVSSLHYDLAQTLRTVQLREEAVKEYHTAIDLDPLMIEAYNNLGITYGEMKNYQSAVHYLQRAIMMDPNYIKAYNNLGVVLAQADSLDAAVGILRRATEVDPEYAATYKNLAMAYIQQRQITRAIETMRTYTKLRPDDQQALEILGQLRRAEAAADSVGGSDPPAGEGDPN